MTDPIPEYRYKIDLSESEAAELQAVLEAGIEAYESDTAFGAVYSRALRNRIYKDRNGIASDRWIDTRGSK